VALDDLDIAIMSQLQADGRKSFTDIARALDISVGTVRNRVSKLIADRTLHIFGRVNPTHVGFQASANIHIAVRPPALISAVASEVGDFPEVSYMALLTGEFDLEIDVACRDQEHLTELLTNRLHRIEGVAETRTQMLLRVYKYAQPDLRLLQKLPVPDNDAPSSIEDNLT
jgi:Lrp/AsnC family transcriptional regulator, regulator for asnA, asnC and gidA